MRPRTLIPALVLGAVSAGFIATDATATASPITCPRVVAQFKATFPVVYQEAGSPSISCVDDRAWHGAGGTNCQERHIDINIRFSDAAKKAGVTEQRRYWRELIAHETGHMWACLHGLDERWIQYEQLRGFGPQDIGGIPVSDPQEDYAETFAKHLGWFTCWGDAPYCFQTSAGAPTSAQFTALINAGMLPAD